MAGHALCRFEVKPFSHESSEKKKEFIWTVLDNTNYNFL